LLLKTAGEDDPKGEAKDVPKVEAKKVSIMLILFPFVRGVGICILLCSLYLLDYSELNVACICCVFIRK